VRLYHATVEEESAEQAGIPELQPEGSNPRRFGAIQLSTA
jgi:hypothetical protein